MPPAAPPSPETYHRIATYLRGHPGAARQSAEQIAQQLEVPVDLVRSVLGVAGAPTGPERSQLPEIAEGFRRVVQGIAHRFERLMERPVLFVFLVSLIGVLVMLAGWRLLPVSNDLPFLKIAFAASVGISVMMLHYLCYFYAGRVRVAFAGSAVLWLVATVGFGVPTVISSRTGYDSLGGPLAAIALLGLGLLFVVLLYLLAAVVLSVLGGYARLRRAERARLQMTRQQLLERLFVIEERLRESASDEVAPVARGNRLSAVLSVRPWLTVTLLAVGTWVFQLSLFLATGVGSLSPETPPSGVPSLGLAGGGLIGFLSWALLGVVAFCSGGLRRSLGLAVLFFAVQAALSALPIGPFGWEHLRDRSVIQWCMAVLAPLSLCLAAALGSKIEQRASLERRLEGNDPEVLLAEMIDIQRRLNPDAVLTHVLFVDVAGSAAMKTGADPLRVEYSFREYQNLVEHACAQFGGRIQSTAGDGAVAEFESASDAFGAARAIQSHIGWFNANVNRMDRPFRLRVGLHSGHVAGELEHVQFAQVIDVAAHVQEVAPIGGIAVTDTMRALLPEVKFLELRDPVDEFVVGIAQEPTEDG